MKFKKLIATAAAVMCAATMAVTSAVTSSAFITEVPSDGYTLSSSGMWLIMLYSDGSWDTDTKNVTNYGIDLTKIRSADITISCDVQKGSMGGNVGYFNNDIGGAVIMSSRAGKDDSRNWNAQQYWGVNDEDFGFASDPDKEVQFQKVKDGEYKATVTFSDEAKTAVIPGYTFVQFAINQYGSSDDFTIESVVMKDADGNVLISFDGNGKANIERVSLDAGKGDKAEETTAAAEETKAEETTAAAEETKAEETTAAAEETKAEETTAAAEETETEIPVDTTETKTEETKTETKDSTATAGDVSAETTSSKGSPDTGVADVAAVAGLAVAAAGAVVLAKKRK